MHGLTNNMPKDSQLVCIAMNAYCFHLFICSLGNVAASWGFEPHVNVVFLLSLVAKACVSRLVFLQTTVMSFAIDKETRNACV